MKARRFVAIVLLGVVTARGEVRVSKPSAGKYPDIAWNGAVFGVAYTNGSGLFRTVGATGAPLGPEANIAPSAGTYIDLISGPGSWAASYWRNTAQIYFQTFDDLGGSILPPRQVNTATPAYYVRYSSLVWNGSAYYIVWDYAPTNSSPVQANITALDGSGNVVVPDQMLVPPPIQEPWIALDSSTGTLGAGWWNTIPARPYYIGANVSAAGVLTGSQMQLGPDTSFPYGYLAARDGGFALAMTSDVTKGPFGWPEVYFTQLDANVDPTGGPIRLSDNGDHLQVGIPAWTGVAFVWPVYYFETSNHEEVYIYRFDKAGQVLGSKQRVPVNDSALGSPDRGPRAAMGKDAVGVVWQDFRSCSPVPCTWYEYVPTVEVMIGGGAGSANPPEVKSLSAFRGQPVLDFAAYGGSGYGANVATGNIDPKPLEEIVTGAGPGAVYGPQVRAFTGGQEPLAKVNYYAYGTLKYGVHASTGDVDGDGMEEIVTGPGPGSVFGPHVRGWNFDGASVTPLGKISYFAYSTLKYGAEVAAGDVDGDNFHEILTGPGPGVIFGAHLRGWNYDNGNVTVMGNVNAFAFTTKYGLLVGAGDITADGAAEILASAGSDPAATSEVRAYSLTPALTQVGSVVPFTTMGGSHVGAGDMTLDGREELATTPGFLPANPGRTKAFDFSTGAFQSMAPWDQDVFPGLAYGATCAIGNVGI